VPRTIFTTADWWPRSIIPDSGLISQNGGIARVPRLSLQEVFEVAFWKTVTCSCQAGVVNNVNKADELAGMVYPTLLEAITNVAHAEWRAGAMGIYRLWRDLGYAAGALISEYRRPLGNCCHSGCSSADANLRLASQA
jgi:hypothetical protein